MASDLDKQAFSHKIEHHEETMSADPEKSPALEPEEEAEITLKTKLAVLSLIFMYESYLFTLIM